MVTAKVEEGSLKSLEKTLFPSGKRYYISATGMAVCLDVSKEIIIYGWLNRSGMLASISVVEFPDEISPKSICICNDIIVLGGQNSDSFGNRAYSSELIVTLDPVSRKSSSIKMPFEVFDKSIDDLLVEEQTVIAVDNIVYPKYIIEYDFSDLANISIIRSHSLPNNGSYESIKKGTQSSNHLALLSSTFGQGGGGTYINLFRRGQFDRCITFSMWHGWDDDNDSSKTYDWRDILLLEEGYLVISASTDGVGLFRADEGLFKYEGGVRRIKDHNDQYYAERIQYFNMHDGVLIKVLRVPGGEHVVMIYEDSKDSEYRCELVSICDLISLYEDVLGPSKPDIVTTLADRYDLAPAEAEELYDLLAEMTPMGFTRSKQLSNYIVEHRLGYKYPNISGIVRMELDGEEWDFEGGFSTWMYRIICQELDLDNQGTRARPVGFTPFKELFQ